MQRECHYFITHNTLTQWLTFPILLVNYRLYLILLLIWEQKFVGTLQCKCFNSDDCARHFTNGIARNNSKLQGTKMQRKMKKKMAHDMFYDLSQYMFMSCEHKGYVLHTGHI